MKESLPPPTMFYFSKCTQPCCQSALHFLLFSFLWFTDKNTWGKKTKKSTIPDPRELWFTTGEKCVALFNRSLLPRIEAGDTIGKTESIKLRGTSAKSFSSPLPAKGIPKRVSLSSSFIIYHCRSSKERNGVFLCRAFHQPKKRANKSFSPCSCQTRPFHHYRVNTEKCISAATSIHEDPRVQGLLQLWLT